jgi:hypothetical protein
MSSAPQFRPPVFKRSFVGFWPRLPRRIFCPWFIAKFFAKTARTDERDQTRGDQQLVSFDLHLPETEAAMHATAHLDQVSCYDLT